MADLPMMLMPHTLTAERALGEGSEGPTYGPPAPVRCRLEGRIDVTADGQHTGSVKVYTRLQHAARLNAGARVTLPDGTRGTVQAVAPHDDGGMGAWQHLEATVQGGA